MIIQVCRLLNIYTKEILFIKKVDQSKEIHSFPYKQDYR